MTNPFEQIPEVTPEPLSPEVEKQEKQVPIEVIEGALATLDDEDSEEEQKPPTIH